MHSSQNPLEVINAHKAYGYGLTGLGETIAIMDTVIGPHIKSLLVIVSPLLPTELLLLQQNQVLIMDYLSASIAAGEDDGTGMQGVAPSASLHLSDYANKNGETDFATHWASATDAAAQQTL